MRDQSWNAIFNEYKIHKHNFKNEPFYISADQIKTATRQFRETKDREPRLLCKHDTREKRPSVFVENNLFLLPVKNGYYAIIKGEGYIDIPTVENLEKIEYKSKLDFHLDTFIDADSQIQHIDYAYASSLVRSFIADPSLVLTIRGRKYTPNFEFNVNGQHIKVESVQTEVDAGYEGKNQVVLIEAKNSGAMNTIIRQLYYPFRQWQIHSTKKVKSLFFEKKGKYYSFWQFEFDDENDYNSIRLVKSAKYEIIQNLV